MPSSENAVWWIFLAGSLALVVILLAFGAAVAIYQRRFVATHRSHAVKLLQAQEEERAWVAREVHDDALQRVALVVQDFLDWEANGVVGPDQQLRRVAALREEIEDLAVMLRRVAHHLHPSLIDQAGLVPALQSLVADVGRAFALRVDLVTTEHSIPEIPREHALILYRVAQEALRNVAKHAKAKSASVGLRMVAGGIELTVVDQGTGFATNGSAQSRGLGLISMAERVRLADGRIEIESQPGIGTTITARIPRRGGPN